MKIIFIANFLNHHQLPFCEKMIELTDNNFIFIATEPLPLEQSLLGYQDMNNKDFVLKSYESQESFKESVLEIENADIVIFGSCPNKYLSIRNKTKKPFIIYSERFFKKGTYRRFIPITYLKIYNRILRYKNSNCFVICSSAFLPYDLSLLKVKFNIRKWGYFPPLIRCNILDKIANKSSEKISIIWVGRFIALKHPELVLKLACRLKKDGYNFSINLYGRGPLEKKINKYILKNKLENFVFIKGSVSHFQVREAMDKSHIFLFTSDFHEGWGAVVNEAMNSGCAVVTSHAVGSAPFLIDNYQNGLIFKNKSFSSLYNKVKYLLNNKKEIERLGINAYNTINSLWNSDCAAERLYTYIKAFLNGDKLEIENGPMSKSNVINPKTYYKKL